ncbi:hypothetical protein IT087_04345 [Candidatus Uhrbacteria bacterium]|nr:hypothetical protein [Candidatus Uhrbacteria bacterium]
MRNLSTIAFLCLNVFAAACSSEPGPVHMTEVECRLNSDCEFGEYCDSFTSLCGWDCRSDSECELGMYCDTRNGRCLREETPLPPPDTSPVLEIEPGSLEDVTLLFGNYDAEIVRFTLTNRSDRAIEVPSISTGFYGTDGFPLTGSMRDVKFESARDRRVLMGPSDEVAGAAGEVQIEFIDSFSIAPGEQVIVVMRADLPDGYVRTEIDLEIGTADGLLLAGLRYADTGEAVPSDRVANNYSIVRHLSIRSEEEVMTVPETVSVFMPESGGRQTIDSGTTADVEVFHITVANTTGEEVRLGDLRITVVTDDGRPWAADGFVPFRSIMVYDSRDGSWLFAPPGASGCGTMGCTFTYDGPTLAPGEATTLEVRVRIATPDQGYLMMVGQGFSSAPGVSDPGAIFHRITNASGDLLPADRIVGNQAGFYYVASR